jgi:hypothetical protein
MGARCELTPDGKVSELCSLLAGSIPNGVTWIVRVTSSIATSARRP